MTATHTPTTLTQSEIDFFIEHGYLHIRNAVPREVAVDAVRRQFTAVGMDPEKSETWTDGPMRSFKGTRSWPAAEIAPRFWGAALDILGGVERTFGPGYTIDDGMTANLGMYAERPWAPPTETAAWHKDGQFFRHFLDSPEQALLALRLWSDVVPRGGATYFAPDSVGPVARFLAKHPEGVHPNGFPWKEMIRECPRLLEATGEAGDVYLMHGYMLHTVAANPEKKLRCISNGIVALREPLQFNRPDPADHSPLERAILRGLGVDRFEFKATRERVRTKDWSPLPKELA
ncbi:MAG: hypothetical protein NTW19_15495 [Planctomycetota bacterium]|nr:hypothetical protein [Planctomycetota bacterium]